MVLRYLLLILLPLLALLLQTTVFHQAAPLNCIPDLLLIFVVCFGIFNGPIKGGCYGLLVGLVEDLYIGRLIGINALCKGVVGYIVGKFQFNVYRERVFIGVAGVFFGTIVSNLLRVLLIAIYSPPAVFYFDMIWQFLVQILYNIVVSIPIYFWYYHSYNQGILRGKTETDSL